MELPEQMYMWDSFEKLILYVKPDLYEAYQNDPGVALAVDTVEERDFLLGLQYITGERQNVILCSDFNRHIDSSKWPIVFFLSDPRCNPNGFI